MNPLLLLILRYLQEEIDWKKILKEQGLPILKEKFLVLLNGYLDKLEPKIVTRMTRQGWTWTNAADPAWLRNKKVGEASINKGAGFCLSRDAVYRMLEIVPGGKVRDTFRDALDDGVWSGITAQVVPGTTTLAELVSLTRAELVKDILHHLRLT